MVVIAVVNVVPGTARRKRISRIVAPTGTVAYRRSNAVAMPVIIGMVRVKMVVPVVNGHVVMMSVPRMYAVIVPTTIGMMPSPPIVEAIMVPSIIIIVWPIVVAGPPPVVTHVNAYTPVAWTIIIPV